MADTELKIVITAVNQAKDVMTQVVTQLGQIQKLVSAGFGADPNDELPKQLKQVGEHAHEAHGFLSELTDKAKETVEGFNKLAEVVEYVTGGFVAMAAVHMAKELADEAAASERLAIALGAVAETAGYTVDQVSKIDKEVQKIGITAEVSRQSLAKMIQNGIDPNAASKLAALANDLTAISGQNTSETFARVAQAIDTGNTLILRRMGLVIDRQLVLNEATRQAGHYLSEQEQRQALLNAVLEKGAAVAGTYGAIQKTAGQLLSDLPTKVSALKDALGELLLPAYTAILQVVSDVTDALTAAIKAFSEGEDSVGSYAAGVEAASRSHSVLAEAIKYLGEVLVSVINFIKDNKDVIKEAFSILFDAAKVLVAIRAVGLLVAGLRTLYTVGWSVAAMITTGLIPAITAAGAALLANPIGLAIAAIGVAALGAYAAVKYFNSESKKTGDVHTSNTEHLKEYNHAVDETIEAQKELYETQEALRKAKERQASSPSDDNDKAVSDAQAKVEEAGKRLAKLKETLNKVKHELDESHLKGDDAKAYEEATNRYAASSATLRKAEEDYQAFLKNFGASGGDLNRYLQGQSKDFQQNLQVIEYSIDNFKDKGTNAEAALNESLRAITKQAKNIVTQADYNDFASLIGKYRKAAEEAKVDVAQALSGILETAADAFTRAQAELEHGGAAGLALFNKHTELLNQALKDEVKAQTDHQKAVNQQTLDIQKEQYDTGLLDTRSYYQERLRISASNTELELRNARLALNTLRQDIANARTAGKSTAEVESLENQAREQENRITAIKDKSQQEQFKIRVEYDKAIFEQNQKVIGQQVKIWTDQGFTLAAKMAQIQSQYEQDLRNIIKGDTLAKSLLDEQKALDEAKAKAEAFAQQVQKLSDLQNTLNDRDEAYVNLLKDKGQLTDLEAQDKLNDITRQRISLTEQQIQTQYALADAYHKAGLEADELQAVQNAVKLEGELVKLNGQIKTVGDTLRSTFQDSFSNSLADAITGAKSWRDAMIGFVKDVNNQMVKMVTKDFTQQFTKMFDGKDESGQGGFFDKMGQLITGRDSKNGDLSKKGLERSNPLFVHVTNQVKELAVQKPTVKPAEKALLPPELANTPTGDALETLAKGFDYATANAALGRKGVLQKPSFDNQFDAVAAAYPVFQNYGEGDFLRWVAAKESAMKPNAVSPAGATGLMQLMPSNFDHYGLTSETAKNPYASIAAGGDMLARLLGKYKDPSLALMAYNWGEGNVDAYIKTGRGLKGGPVPAETKDYAGTLTPLVTGGGTVAASTAKMEKQSAAVDKLAANSDTQVQLAKEAASGQISPNALGTESNPLFVKVVNQLFSDGQGGVKSADSNTVVKDPVGQSQQAEAVAKAQTSAWTDMFKASPTDTTDPFTSEKGMMALNGLGDSLPILGAGLAQFGRGSGSAALGTIGAIAGKALSSYAASQGGLGSLLGNLFGGLGGDAAGAGIAGATAGDVAAAGEGLMFLADGGKVMGAGTSTSDSIHAMLSDGEYVMTADKTKQFLPVLEAMRSGALDRLGNIQRPPMVKKFALGGIVGGNGTTGLIHGSRLVDATGNNPTVHMTINTPDANSFRQSQDQIMAEMGAKMSRAMKRNG